MTPAALRADARTLADTAQAIAEACPLYAPAMMGVVAFAIGMAMLSVVTEAMAEPARPTGVERRR